MFKPKITYFTQDSLIILQFWLTTNWNSLGRKRLYLSNCTPCLRYPHKGSGTGDARFYINFMLQILCFWICKLHHIYIGFSKAWFSCKKKNLYLQILLVKQSIFYTSKYSNFQWFRSVNIRIIRVVAVLVDLSDVF